MFAKRLFHVSASILCLALAYHIGATTAKAAKPIDDPIVGIAYESFGACAGPIAVSQSGNVYGGCNLGGPFALRGSVPGPVAGITRSGGAFILIVLQNGDLYQVVDPTLDTWTFLRQGNIHG